MAAGNKRPLDSDYQYQTEDYGGSEYYSTESTEDSGNNETDDSDEEFTAEEIDALQEHYKNLCMWETLSAYKIAQEIKTLTNERNKLALEMKNNNRKGSTTQKRSTKKQTLGKKRTRLTHVDNALVQLVEMLILEYQIKCAKAANATTELRLGLPASEPQEIWTQNVFAKHEDGGVWDIKTMPPGTSNVIDDMLCRIKYNSAKIENSIRLLKLNLIK